MYQELKHELKQLLLNIQSYEELKMFDQRQTAIFQAVNIARALTYKAGYRSIELNTNYPIPEWASNIVAFIELPTGQVAYFLKNENVDWDAHDRSTKLERISQYVEALNSN